MPLFQSHYQNYHTHIKRKTKLNHNIQMYIISYLHFLQIEYLPLFTFSKFEFESWKKGNISLKIISDKSFMMKLCLYENHIGELWSEALYERDHCSYIHNFCSCKKKAWKKFRLVWDLNPWPLRCRCSALPIKLTRQLRAGHWIGLL